MASERKILNLGSFVGKSEKANRIAIICDIFLEKPMFPLDLYIHGTWLTSNVVVGSSCGYRKSVTTGNPK